MSETRRFLLISILIGIFAGLMVVCFHIAIDFVSWYSLGALSGRFRFGRLISPTLGALAAGALVLRVFRAAQGSGVNQTKAALYISDGYVPPSTIAGKFLACSIAIGSGNSLGPEDPSLQMGAGVASLLGRMFDLKRRNMRLIAPVGAAAGIAAAFNTPITGVLFVMEEVVAAWNAGVIGSIVLAAVSAVVVTRWFLGNEPLFRVPAFELAHATELFIYAGIGAISGVLSAGFVKLIEVIRDRADHLPPWTRYAQPAIAGLLTGIIGLWLPEIMGAGYDAIDNALHGRFPWQLLLVLGLAKIAATALCFSAGTPGGMFAPTLFVGAMIGGALGGAAHHFWPFPSSPAEAYVLVGMGTFFAGVFRAPMTSIFMVFEVSASYVIILPVMIANTIAYFVSRNLYKVPFFTMLARQEGVDLPSAEEQRSQPALHVEDAMSTVRPPVFGPDATVAAALETHADYVFAKEPGLEWRIARRADLERAPAEEPLARVAGLAPRLYPDLTIDAALRLLADHPVLPVVSRNRPDQLLGTLTLTDVHRAYGIE